jgi:hypothetical protein
MWPKTPQHTRCLFQIAQPVSPLAILAHIVVVRDRQALMKAVGRSVHTLQLLPEQIGTTIIENSIA